MCIELLNDHEMSSVFSSRSHHCFNLNCHRLPHFGYPYYLPHSNHPQHPPLALPNKSFSNSGKRSNADEVSMRNLLRVVAFDLRLTLDRSIVNGQN